MVEIFFNGNLSIWFFTLIMILYILFPLLFKFNKSFGNIGTFLLIMVDIAFNFVIMKHCPIMYSRIEIMLLRVPAFLVGIIIANLAYNKKYINKQLIFIGSLLIIILANTGYYIGLFNDCLLLQRYVNGIISVALILLFSQILSNKNILINRILAWIGSYSLEIYLLYEYLIRHCWSLFPYYDRINFCYYVCIICLTVVLQIILKNTTNSIVKVFDDDSK